MSPSCPCCEGLVLNPRAPVQSLSAAEMRRDARPGPATGLGWDRGQTLTSAGFTSLPAEWRPLAALSLEGRQVRLRRGSGDECGGGGGADRDCEGRSPASPLS